MKIRIPLRSTAICVGMFSVGLIGLAGCSSPVDRRADAWGGEGPHTAARKPIASQAGSWESVFLTPGVNARLADAGEGPEYARLDSTLNPRANQPLTAIDSWPEAPRADLARGRSIRVRDNQNTFIYYFPAGNGRAGSGGTSSDRPGWWY